MASQGPPPAYRKHDAVEAKSLSGWTPGTVVDVVRLRPGVFLYQVQTAGRIAPRSCRADQLRRPEQCAGCTRLTAENRVLAKRLEQALAELRKWVEAG